MSQPEPQPRLRARPPAPGSGRRRLAVLLAVGLLIMAAAFGGSVLFSRHYHPVQRTPQPTPSSR